MTKALVCDGCGLLVSERAEDGPDRAARRWWELIPDPGIGGALLGIALPLIVDEDDPLVAEADRPAPPALHACSWECVRAIAERDEPKSPEEYG